MSNEIDNAIKEVTEVTESTGELLDELISSTREGAIKWETMSLVGHYALLLGSKAICIGILPNEKDRIYYSILDTKDEKVLFKIAFTPQDALYEKINNLYHLVQLYDSRIKHMTDNLISELKSMSSVDFSSITNTTPVAEL